MNQTRTFLIFAWIMVAVLLWMAWSKEQNAPPAATATSVATTIPAAIPGQPQADPNAPNSGVPSAPSASGAPPAGVGMPAAGANRIVVSTDVLRLTLDGGNVFDADLLRYPKTRDSGSAPVRLLDENPAQYYVAQSGWVGQNGSAAPNHTEGFVAEHPQTSVTLAPGQRQVVVPFVWQGPDGVRIRRTYTLTRGSYAIELRDQVINDGGKPWQGYPYGQLMRLPPVVKSGMTNPESYSFTGATWYSADGGYNRRKYKDFDSDGPLDLATKGGWVALLQHHFFGAWIPQHEQSSRFNLVKLGNIEGIRWLADAPTVVVPGKTAATEARLYLGPKLVSQINAQGVPGLDRAVDYSRFDTMAILAQGLFWVLNKLHSVLGNWGWAIVAMVCILKLLLFPLSAAQYKSAAKMRKFQPRIAQLKERYGDDKQKFQVAMMELYKKEKINPVGGCLPILPQMIIFMALYWMLAESVELRQAPWTLWIQDLTARDPYFILPIVNMAIMWTTQKLTPAVGMDPMQQKMMQTMPLVFGVILAFLPAGLVLYQVANGGLGLLQQWIITRRYADAGKPVLIEKD